ncbi:MAG: hypothetical protein ACO1SV_18115 [Fimbriimonas sp.]
MIALIANPKAWHGKYVRLIGYAHLEFEGRGLYIHRQDQLNAISKNGLWLNGLSKGAKLEGKPSVDQYVIVEGRFSATDRGHLGGWSGAIVDIRRFNLWSHPDRGPSWRRQKEGRSKPVQ